MDVVTYALLTKKIESSATGIGSIELRTDSVTGEYNLVFIMADESENSVKLPVKPDCINIERVSSLPISNISTNTIYLTKKAGTTDIYYQNIFVDGVWQVIGTSGMPYATTTEAGLVKPDGETIVVDANGVISVKKEGLDTYMEENLSDYIDDYLDDSDNKISDDSIDGLF